MWAVLRLQYFADMANFNNDYIRGAHPEVMKALVDTNMVATPGYGKDEFTADARRLILKECGLERGDVRFLVGGTQTNAVVIDGLIRRHEGVMAADSSHINVHESGAIEASGHKVIVLPTVDGKIAADDIRRYMRDFYADDTCDHMVTPAMVYITYPTELGTLYSLTELEEIAAVCGEWRIPLYIDGARLGYGLESPDSDVTIRDIARLADVFYIGGTKCGALFGEAVVMKNPGLIPAFFSHQKMHGALLAKGRLLGVQFGALFRDGLYFRICREAVRLALRLRDAFVNAGFRVAAPSSTNQQFFLLDNLTVDRLRDAGIGFELIGPRGEWESTVRFVTDWSTTPADVAEVERVLEGFGIMNDGE